MHRSYTILLGTSSPLVLVPSVLQFDGQREAVAHSEHAQADPSVSVQLLVEPVDGQCIGVVRGGLQHLAAPQHLHMEKVLKK